jgi:hypothetical protein
MDTLKNAAARILARLREEQGFTMVVVMGVLLVATAFSVAAIAAADNDDPQARKDTDSKQAYAAAEAGINYYVFHLNNDNAFWAACTHSGDANLATPTGLNQVGANPSSWRNVPGESSRFALELLPANGAGSCDPANAQQTMIDQNSGSFKIRSTGLANGVRRSIVATFKKRGFLDYIWFTDYEIRDPLVSGDPASCVKHRWEGRPNGCAEINFVTGDDVQGPMHTNDQFLVCGTPTFGRSGGSDKIEATEPPPNKVWRGGTCGTNQPTMNGNEVPGAPLMSLPPSNGQLAALASGVFKPTGQTDIELRSNPAKVCMRPLAAYPKYWTQQGTPYTCYDPPANGVLYVQSGSCGVTYDQSDPYNVPSGCGEAWVHGTYSSNLTIGADKDVVVDGNVINGGSAMLGLIANNFVRVYHPVKTCANDTTAGSGLLGSIEVDAAILSLNHSWAVDNYGCGAALGTLTVKGAIAQKFRGTVGLLGGSGYLKNYQYDDRLVFRSPPSFLDPVQASWRIARYNEQLPPSTLTGP